MSQVIQNGQLLDDAHTARVKLVEDNKWILVIANEARGARLIVPSTFMTLSSKVNTSSEVSALFNAQPRIEVTMTFANSSKANKFYEFLNKPQNY